MSRDLRLPVELALLREIRQRASQHCADCNPQTWQATLADLKQALDRLEQLEREAAASRRYDLLPLPNVLDRGE